MGGDGIERGRGLVVGGRAVVSSVFCRGRGACRRVCRGGDGGGRVWDGGVVDVGDVDGGDVNADANAGGDGDAQTCPCWCYSAS